MDILISLRKNKAQSQSQGHLLLENHFMIMDILISLPINENLVLSEALNEALSEALVVNLVLREALVVNLVLSEALNEA